jgi:hypothetical protein
VRAAAFVFCASSITSAANVFFKHLFSFMMTPFCGIRTPRTPEKCQHNYYTKPGATTNFGIWGIAVMSHECDNKHFLVVISVFDNLF